MAKSPKARTKKKERRYVLQGVVHISSTFNNTIVSSTDPQGQVIAWASAGTVGFKGAKKARHSPLSKLQNPWLSVRWTRA